MKKRKLDLPPTSAGRVSGFGLNMKVRDYYESDAKSKKARKVTGVAKAEVEELRKQVEDLKQVNEQLPNLVASQVSETIKSMIPPNLWEGIAACGRSTRAGTRARLHRQQLEQEHQAGLAGPRDPRA